MKYFNFKFLTVLFALALAIPLAVSAEEVTVCDGTSTTEYLPLYGYYFDEAQHNQMIYPASELGDLPSGARITSITFYPDRDIPEKLKGHDVKFSMANLEAGTVFEVDVYGSANPLNVEVDLVTTVTIDNNPWVITLDEPFEYNGGDLLIDVLTPAADWARLYFTSKSFDDYYGYYSYGTSTKKGLKELPKLTITYEVGDLDPYKVKISPSSIDFDTTAPNNPQTQNVTVKNLGANAITPTVSGLAAPFSTTYTPTEIASGETVTIPIVFNPTTIGDFEATILVGDAGGNITPVEIPLTGSAANIATIADGTSTNKYVPFYGYYYDNQQINQMIYPEDMLTNLKGKIINSITFYTADELAFYNGVYDVQMGMTDISSYDSKVRITEGLEIVASDLTAAKGGQELTINFSNPFTYTGGNLLIDINVKTKGNYGSNNFYGIEADNASFYSYGSTLNSDGVYSGGSIQDFLPKITFAYDDGGVILDQVATPTFDPEEGTYTEAQTVTISCETGDATIYYTIDGTNPTTESAVYSEPISVENTTTIKAFAVKENMTDSRVATATYTIKIPGASTTFEKVTSADQIEAGKRYIFVSGNYAMGEIENGFGSVISITGGDEVTVDDDVAIFTLGGTTGAWTLAFADGTYLTAGNGTNLNSGTSATNWIISSETTDGGGFRAKHADYNRAVKKHNSMDRFGNYSTGDTNSTFAWIYVEKAQETPTPVLVVEPDELILDEDNNTFVVMGENLKGDVNITVDNENFTVTPASIAKADAEASEGATVTVTYTGTDTEGELATITVASEDAESVTVSVLGAAPAPVEIADLTFTPEPGSYTEGQSVVIGCETEGAVISYSTDGGNNWTEGNSVTVGEDMTLMAKAVLNGTEITAEAVYSFEFPVDPITIEAFDGYYKIKNNGNEQYANVVGRKTLRFTNDIDTEAGTVIRLKTDEHGKVISLRSQAADLQGYADKAMNYVPELVHLVAEKLDMEGVGQLFGENGVDAILDKFNEAFDHHLYVEPAEGGYRIYGKTPSMQPVVEFYRENQAKCDAKLPLLEDAINHAIEKILEKTNGSGAAILTPFSLHTIWEKMDNDYLIEPVDDASVLAFYHQVLMNKDFVWSFAYETAMIYWTNLKNHPKYETMIKPNLGEFADYIDKIENVRPNFKYYIVQKDNKPDFISEGNGDIDAARSIWTVEPRTDFVVNVPEETTYFNKYVTTLYTDFAYDLPDGVTAYKVVGVNDDAYAQIKALEGTIPAQTPVILIAKTAGDITLTLNNNDGTAPADNQLKGPDYLIGKYQIKTPTVENLFNLVKDLFGEEIYNRYMLDYEHLMLRYAGQVNNKYFWSLSDSEIEECVYELDGDEDCVVRSLDATEGDDAAFYDNWTVSTNKAFLVTETHDVIKIMIKGDINRDGKANIADVTALIDILLWLPEEPFTEEYDYVAADFDEDGTIRIKDLTDLIDYLLDNGIEGDNGNPDPDIIYDNE